MGEVVNLNRFRKQAARRQAAADAAGNRARFGRTKAERAADTDEAGRADRAMDGRRLDRDDEPPPGAAG